jgi:hypothetical protein
MTLQALLRRPSAFVPMAAFAITWLPRAPRPALKVLALQLAAALVPIATIVILES